MRVAIDSGPLTGGHSMRGIGVNTRELIEGIKELSDKVIKFEAVDFGKAELSRYDIVHYPYFHPFFLTLPKARPAKRVVVTIHDLIPLIYPKHYPPGIKGKLRFVEQKRRLKQADAIITISETSRKDIVRFLRVDPGKVFVTHLAHRKFLRKVENPKTKYKLPKDFVFYVGDVNYNKNFPTLVKACKKAGKPLVVAGKQAKEIFDEDNFDHPELAHLRGLRLDGGKVVLLGYVSDSELVNLFNLASVYVQPSLYEGFGLPVLEALACGTPTVASKTQAHVEIAGGVVDFFDPKSVDDLAEKIKSARFRSKLAKKCLARYSWQLTAEKTVEVYKKVYAGKS